VHEDKASNEDVIDSPYGECLKTLSGHEDKAPNNYTLLLYGEYLRTKSVPPNR